MRALCRMCRARGYSLMELMVASVGAMAIAVAVVGLSKMSETTMHGEERIARADAELRDMGAMLRNDIARAGYMSSSWARVGRDPTFVPTQDDSETASGVLTVPPLGITGTACASPLYVGALGASPGALGTGASGFDGDKDVRYAYCNVANFRRLAAVRYFPGGSIAGSEGMSVVNGIRPDAIILSANYATADDYFLRGIDASVTGLPPSLIVDFSSAAGSRAFGLNNAGAIDSVRFPTSQTMVSSLFLDPGMGGTTTSKNGMYRVVDDQGFSQFQYTTPGTGAANTMTVNAGPPPAMYVPAAVSAPYLARASANAAGGLSGALIAVGGLFNPVNSFLYQVECDPTVAGCLSYALTKRAIGPSGVPNDVPGVGSSPYYPIVMAHNVVDFQVAFRVAENAGPPYAIRDLAFSTASAAARADNVAYSDVDDANADAARGPHRIIGVRFMLAVRSNEADRTEALNNNAGSPVHGRYCMKTAGACASGDNYARVRSVVLEATVNGAGRFLR